MKCANCQGFSHSRLLIFIVLFDYSQDPDNERYKEDDFPSEDGNKEW